MTAAILVGGSALFAQKATKAKEKPVTIIGRVAAKVWDLQNIQTTNTGKHLGSMTIFILQMESQDHSTEPEKYVRVSYLYSSSMEILPKSFFDYSIRYQFHLTREPSCDGFVTDIRDPDAAKFPGISAEINPTMNSPLLDLHDHRTFDCYVLRPGDYKIKPKR